MACTHCLCDSGPGILKLDNQKRLFVCLAVIVWTSFNNFWSIACEGKHFDEINIGDGLIPDTGLKKESPQKRVAAYPKVPVQYLSKTPEGVILGTYKNRYVRVPTDTIHHYCILGGTGSGKSSTILIDSLLANFSKDTRIPWYSPLTLRVSCMRRPRKPLLKMSS